MCCRDHPRACGEQHGVAQTGLSHGGSSPRVRGTGSRGADSLRNRGIIPARAGNSARRAIRGAATRDHPRACGEQRVQAGRFRLSRGSSPRVRGTASNIHDKLLDAGIIPARAGNSRFTIRPRSLHRDHPRACGEQRLWHVPPHCRSGSSPRVRGTVLPVVVNAVVQGIIPARAGNSVGVPKALVSKRDHPRACGEQVVRELLVGRDQGSSPRVRGTGFVLPVRARYPGIIPARAGNRRSRRSRSRSRRDHPRACGEQA